MLGQLNKIIFIMKRKLSKNSAPAKFKAILGSFPWPSLKQSKWRGNNQLFAFLMKKTKFELKWEKKGNRDIFYNV